MDFILGFVIGLVVSVFVSVGLLIALTRPKKQDDYQPEPYTWRREEVLDAEEIAAYERQGFKMIGEGE